MPTTDASNPYPDKVTAQWRTIGRFASREMADALTETAQGFGIPAVVRGPATGHDQETGFDASLGGMDSGRMVEVKIPPQEAPKLLAALECDLEIGEDEPMRTLSPADLRSAAAGEESWGIQEQAIARKLLREQSENPDISSALATDAPEPDDIHLSTDRRRGVYIAIFGWLLSLCFLGLTAALHVQHFRIPPVWALDGTLLGAAAALSLLLARRHFPAQKSRKMFPLSQRIQGAIMLAVNLVAMAWNFVIWMRR